MKIYFHLNLEGFSNCYVIVNELTSEAIIVDPGIITPQIIENIENGDYKLTGVLVTHNHGSHVHGLQTLRKIYSPKIFAADWEVAGNETSVLKDEGIIQIAGLTVGYTSVPGHTPDSMVYKIGSVLFTGDVISAGKIGSSNNKFSEKALIKNINEKILSQQDETILMPGHGPPTTVGAEKLFNISVNPPDSGRREKLDLD
ncbi:MAG: MBL fold metallo-hydrolase [Treponema sp.]|uniref:MBL fold metallo-hydrolase n=1 Tax=Treponema sp. TaxID=166 RepID=UPI00298EBA26|nr:MBL fold metallo-hydrolase [Treponema sp.]MCR5385961.1 MBL fold metallo-hydrolase [Treponema sp.]